MYVYLCVCVCVSIYIYILKKYFSPLIKYYIQVIIILQIYTSQYLKLTIICEIYIKFINFYSIKQSDIYSINKVSIIIFEEDTSTLVI